MSYLVERLSHRDLLRLSSFDWMICPCQLGQVRESAECQQKSQLGRAKRTAHRHANFKKYSKSKELPTDMLCFKKITSVKRTAYRHPKFKKYSKSKELPTDMPTSKNIPSPKNCPRTCFLSGKIYKSQELPTDMLFV